jgi:RecA-family ATPase
MNMSDMVTAVSEKLQWLVDGLLLQCGLSLVCAKPKVAKSVLVRNLALCVARGDSFLGRRIEAGPVIYIGLEDSKAIVSDHFRKLGATASDQIFFVADPITLADLKNLIAQ